MSWRRRLAVRVAVPAALAWAAAVALARVEEGWALAATEWVVGAALLASLAVAGLAVALPAATPRAALLRGACAAVSLASTVALAELPALLGLVDYGRVWSVASGEWVGPTTGFVSDPELAWARPAHSRWVGRPRGDLAVEFNLPLRAPAVQSFSTDARGFRNARDLARADVALLGDSYVEGAYVSDSETAAVGLERLLGRDVANLGRSGYGTLQQLEVLRRVALPLQPRAVAWFFFEGNDLYDDEVYENALAYLKQHGRYAPSRGLRPDLRAFAEGSLVRASFRAARRALAPLIPIAAGSYGLFPRGAARPVRVYFYRDAVLRFEGFEQDRLEKAATAFRRGAELCRQRGVRLLLVFVPSKFRVYGERSELPEGSACRGWRLWDLDRRFAALCQREGLPILDLTGPLRAEADRGALLYAPEDSHWNADGHRLVAELLAEELAP